MAIPKIVHYCWFGGKEKPDSVKKCIESWKKFLPDYQLMEWNEDNFNIEKLKYTKEAYAEGKYAFVSDVARIEALYQYGGIYMDTDENIRFLDENGQINTGTNVTKLTNMLMEKGFVQENHYQELEEGIKIYPKDFFSPYDYINCHYNITENSYCVHHFAVSWMSKKEQVKKRIKKQLSKILGPKKMNKIREKIKG